ncbi:hypothetical protein BH160DRAFT_2080 [Burkholderia sp. H160]|nr:hypothetical protein BH160DRAFT_2080 [Burkholderia sp. H160]
MKPCSIAFYCGWGKGSLVHQGVTAVPKKAAELEAHDEPQKKND